MGQTAYVLSSFLFVSLYMVCDGEDGGGDDDAVDTELL